MQLWLRQRAQRAQQPRFRRRRLVVHCPLLDSLLLSLQRFVRPRQAAERRDRGRRGAFAGGEGVVQGSVATNVDCGKRAGLRGGYGVDNAQRAVARRDVQGCRAVAVLQSCKIETWTQSRVQMTRSCFTACTFVAMKQMT